MQSGCTRTRSRAALRSAAGGAALLITTAVAVDAAAFCREITENAPVGYNPVNSGCWAGDAPGVFSVYWKNVCVSYSIQKDGTKWMPLPIVKGIAAQAFGAWNQVVCGDAGPLSITATEMEPPGEDGVDCSQVEFVNGGANQHVIVFRDSGWPYPEDAANVLGFTTVQFASDTGEILDADMEINSHDFQLVPLPPVVPNQMPPEVDLLSVLTHEAGHFLGLAHSSQLDAMMYAFYAPGATLDQDDVDGICSIYAPDGTRSTSLGSVAYDTCNPTPSGA
jgi:hypothetical protein